MILKIFDRNQMTTTNSPKLNFYTNDSKQLGLEE